MTRCKTARTLLAVSALWLAAPGAQAQDAVAGRKLFQQRCQTCHSVDRSGKAGIGPNLATVSRRKAGSGAFKYSPALKASGLTWDKPTLDAFLTAPMKKVPGTRMVISLPDARQRGDVIAYLSTLNP